MTNIKTEIFTLCYFRKSNPAVLTYLIIIIKYKIQTTLTLSRRVSYLHYMQCCNVLQHNVACWKYSSRDHVPPFHLPLFPFPPFSSTPVVLLGHPQKGYTERTSPCNWTLSLTYLHLVQCFQNYVLVQIASGSWSPWQCCGVVLFHFGLPQHG